MVDLTLPRRTWLDGKIDVFLEELAASGMHLERQRAGELIPGQVRAVATLMIVSEATGRTRRGREIIKDMARRMLFEVAGERPGPTRWAPRFLRCRSPRWGLPPALAEAMQVRAANEPPDHLGDFIAADPQTCPGSGDHRRRRAGMRDPAEILFPPALLRRAARYISGAADWPRTAANSRTRFPRRHAASWPRPCTEETDGLIAITTTD